MKSTSVEEECTCSQPSFEERMGREQNKQNSCVVAKANTTRNSVGVNPQVEATIKSFETNRGDANLSCLSTSLLNRVLLVEDSASTEWLL